MKNIHFIINALSVYAKETEAEIQRHFESTPHLTTIKVSEYKGHAVEQTMKSVSEGAEIVVACGGDGTVHEVAKCLVHTSVCMGILPIGSGNGLARNLGIPLDLSTALKHLERFETKKIDVGKANEFYFVCNLSVAFTAHVVNCYEQNGNRGFKGYLQAFGKALSSFSYPSFEIEESVNRFKSTPFILMFSNTDQLGYNKTLTPNASLYDGKLDLICIERRSPFMLFLFLLFAFFGKFPQFFKPYRKQTEKVRLLSHNPVLKFQIDGENLELATEELYITVLPRSLGVIC